MRPKKRPTAMSLMALRLDMGAHSSRTTLLAYITLKALKMRLEKIISFKRVPLS
jgi:hypothetical protein